MSTYLKLLHQFVHQSGTNNPFKGGQLEALGSEHVMTEQEIMALKRKRVGFTYQEENLYGEGGEALKQVVLLGTLVLLPCSTGYLNADENKSFLNR